MSRRHAVPRIAAAIALVAAAACAPKLERPGESTRISGSVTASGPPIPVQIYVFERCSSRFLVFERCPGKFLGEAKLGKPDKFVIEVDPKSDGVSIVAMRGNPGAEDQCALAERSLGELATPVDLELTDGPCSAHVEAPSGAPIPP